MVKTLSNLGVCVKVKSCAWCEVGSIHFSYVDIQLWQHNLFKTIHSSKGIFLSPLVICKTFFAGYGPQARASWHGDKHPGCLLGSALSMNIYQRRERSRIWESNELGCDVGIIKSQPIPREALRLGQYYSCPEELVFISSTSASLWIQTVPGKETQSQWDGSL